MAGAALTPNDDSQTPFERIRQEDAEGVEFWSARDLMPTLEYVSWQKFKNVLIKAQLACENSGYDPGDHFIQAVKMVAIGSDAKREVEDMHLSRYACYLVVQNADPAKEVVALGQTYFAVQTRRQEVSDAAAMAELTEDQRRLLLRQRIKHQNTDLTYHTETYRLLTHTPIDTARAIAATTKHYNMLGGNEVLRKERLLDALEWTTLDLYQRPAHFSPENLTTLHRFETLHNVALPASVREWYALDISPNIMSATGAEYAFTDEFSPFDEASPGYDGDRIPGLWYFLAAEYTDQGYDDLFFPIDGRDDPPVYARGDDRLIRIADTFSSFIYQHFWRWLSLYGYRFRLILSVFIGIPSLNLPDRYHLSVAQLQNLMNEQLLFSGPSFYDVHTRIIVGWLRPEDAARLAVDPAMTNAALCADSLDALEELVTALWSDDPPIRHLREASPYLDANERSQLNAYLSRIREGKRS